MYVRYCQNQPEFFFCNGAFIRSTKSCTHNKNNLGMYTLQRNANHKHKKQVKKEMVRKQFAILEAYIYSSCWRKEWMEFPDGEEKYCKLTTWVSILPRGACFVLD
jgi:hypothetical protein